VRPYLLLDVDGVLNPDFTNRTKMKRQRRSDDWVRTRGYDGIKSEWYPLFLNRTHGPALLKLAAQTGAELAWGTTWNEDANKWVGPVVGLPNLPVLTAKRWAKTATVLPALNGRPFVWLDDEPYVIAAADESGHGHGVLVDHREGLRPKDLEVAGVLLAALTAAYTT
jgi:hypothetical protein